MKGLVVNHSVVELRELPSPILLTDKHVVLDVLVAGICKTDISIATGRIEGLHEKPFGHEFCARVVEIGSQVTSLHIGQRVAVNPVIACDKCEFCRSGDKHLCANTGLLGIDEPGVFCERVCLPAERCYPVGVFQASCRLKVKTMPP